MFTETVIVSLTDLLLGDTSKKKKVGHILKKSIPENTDKNSTNLDAG